MNSVYISSEDDRILLLARPIMVQTLEQTVADDDVLIFEMGMYKARIPRRLRYSEIHFWFDPQPTGTKLGLTSYAARLLGDLYRIEWQVRPGDAIQPEQVLGTVESTKAASELYAPMTGRLATVNTGLVDDPSRLALDPYAAWLLEFENAPAHSLSAEEYVAVLAAGWDETVKLLKGLV